METCRYCGQPIVDKYYREGLGKLYELIFVCKIGHKYSVPRVETKGLRTVKSKKKLLKESQIELGFT